MKLDQTFKTQIEKIENTVLKSILITNKTKAKNDLLTLFREYIKNKITDKIAISFSGGIDSTFLTFLCKEQKKDFHLYTVGLKGSKDLEQARMLSDVYDLPLTSKLLTGYEAEQIIKEVTGLLSTNDPIKVGVGSTFYAVLELVKKNNINSVITGLGSEEIFAGYQRHKLALKENRVNQECFSGLKNMYEKDLERDIKILEHFNIKGLAPFLDRKIIEYAMTLDPELKINLKQNKIIVRDMGEELGIKKEYSQRKKIAAQYGSRFDHYIGKLAKQNGFKYKKDYLTSLL